jgi:hypothetical protein
MTMREDLMKRLLKGWCTPYDALRDCGCLSLSQRCGEFQREAEADRMRMTFHDVLGTKRPPSIQKKWVHLVNGKRVKAYRAVR